MFSNFLKKLATKDYKLFAEATFIVLEGGQKVEITTYDLLGVRNSVVDWKSITNDFLFLTIGCGSYVPVWIAQLIDDTVRRKDNDFITKIFRLEDVFSTPDDELHFDNCYALINNQIRSLVFANNAKIRFLIHPVSKGTMVQVVNIPLLEGPLCEYFLLLRLIEYMNLRYPRSTKLLKDMGRELFAQFNADPDVISRPSTLRAYAITNQCALRAMENI